ANGDLYPLIERYASELPDLFIVSQVSLDGQSDTALSVHVERASGDKCPRCWKYKDDVGADKEIPSVCARCAAAIRQNLQDS
ncbi:MAG: hypothetical protein GY953_52990, partial [bacterium]|nr:hypothetical protein [bacterium]